jgi:HEAT repeat protein
LGRAEAVQPLIKALGDRQDYVRASVAGALAKLADPAAAEPLHRLLLDSNGAVRANAAKAMGVLHYRAAIPELIALLVTQEYGREEVIRALGELAARQAVPKLTQLLAANDPDGQACSEVLEKLGAPTFEPLFAAAWAADGLCWSWHALRENYPDKTVARVAPMLDDPAREAKAAMLLRTMQTSAAGRALAEHGLPTTSY